MTINYDFDINGTAAEGQTWTVEGAVEAERPGQFMEMIGWAIKFAFEQLTEGKAFYGHPGVGCNGPYRITSMYIVERPNLEALAPGELESIIKGELE